MRAQERRRERRHTLQRVLADNPFCTDDELAGMLHVSVQTIRLDRMALGLPELRARVRAMAENAHSQLRTLGSKEIVGDLLDLKLGERAISLLTTDESMTFERSQAIRGQFLFAQAESLALAVLDVPVARTRVANAKFKSEVRSGERLIAVAEVIRQPEPCEYVVLVQIHTADRSVFRAKFMMQTVSVEAVTTESRD